MIRSALCLLVSGIAVLRAALQAETLPRTAPVSGAIISTRSGETAVPVPSPPGISAAIAHLLPPGAGIAIEIGEDTAQRFAPDIRLRLVDHVAVCGKAEQTGCYSLVA